MKKIWIIILLCIAVGLVLSVIGLATGASRSLYWDRAGIHISESSTGIPVGILIELFDD